MAGLPRPGGMMNATAIIAELSKPSTQQILILAAVVVATVVVLKMRGRRPLDGSPRQYRREIDSATARSSAVKRDMEQLLTALDELSRDISAQIDTRFAKLEQSIADADKRISALRILIEEAKKTGAGPRADSAAPSAPTPTATIATTAGSPTDPQPAEQAGSPSAPDERSRRIYELADQGRTPMQIAQELDQKIGEVELILNLRNSTR